MKKSTDITVYYHIESFANKIGITSSFKIADFLIYRFEDESKVNYNNLETYRQDYYEILLDISEGCNFSVDNHIIQSQKNRITLIKPFQLQKINSHPASSEPISGYSIFFKPSFISNKSIITKLPIFTTPTSVTTTFNDAEIIDFKDIANKTITEYKDFNPAISTLVIQNYLEIFFLKLQYKSFVQKNYTVAKKAGQTIFNIFYQSVQTNFLELSYIKEYAMLMHISPKHLSETIKEESGKSALTFINDAKIEYAKVLLLQTDKTISEIAFELNFNTTNYFSVLFKKHTGIKPSQFRT